MSSTNNKLTYLDQLVTSPNMQLAKAVLPYIGKNGNLLAVYIKFLELQNTIKYLSNPNHAKLSAFSNNGQNVSDISCLLEELKDFLDDDMVETLELITSLFTMMKENPDNCDDIMSGYMDMFKGML